MIKLPDFKKSFEYENNFYLSCASARIGKIVVHYELYKKTQHLKGAIIEAGVFKGASFVRFAMLEKILNPKNPRKIIGFDSFGEFPETKFKQDKALRQQFIDEIGKEGISKEQLEEVLTHKEVNSFVQLVKGNIVETAKSYVKDNPNLSISLINLDADVYEPSIAVLEHFYPRLLHGGILILDNYGEFPGETKAVDEYFNGQNIEIKNFPFCKTPRYIIKK